MSDLGVYDLGLTEVIWRLVEPGDVVIDAGANIGYVTSLMAARVGQDGQVYSFEPHPEIFDDLLENQNRWRESNRWEHVHVRQVALSNRTGEGSLSLPEGFGENRGTATLLNERRGAGEFGVDRATQTCTVRLEKLDDLFRDDEKIKLIKVDVEGHELEVLEGASALIGKGVRDIVFEEHRGYPSDVTCFLESHAYSVFRISKAFRGPRLEDPTEVKTPDVPWEPPNYLATKDPQRAISLVNKNGWASLSGI